MRTQSHLAALLAALSLATACVASTNESAEDLDARSDATTAGIVEGTPEAKGVLKLASEADYDTLHSATNVGLVKTTANHILAYRSSDANHKFDTLKELDAVPYVGPTAFKKLLAYALAHGYVEETPLLCEPHHFQKAVPASGTAMMAYGKKGYLFASDGVNWTIVENESGVTKAIPLPTGVSAMQDVRTELGPNGRPLVVFRSGNEEYATLFDGAKFVGTVDLGKTTSSSLYPWLVAHADAKEHIYATTANGLVEYPPNGGAPIFRGALPFTDQNHPLWGVGANGTVYVLNSKYRFGTNGANDEHVDLLIKKLPHGSLTWSDDTVLTTNAGYGFADAHFAAAPDGSLHVAYSITDDGVYFRSHDGKTWEHETFMDIVSKATMVDVASPGIDEEDPARVKGSVRLLAAEDYDHASITMMYNGGSFTVPSFYFLRRCAPFQGLDDTWPAERLALSGAAFDTGAVAVNERGLVTLLTGFGVRQDVANSP